jgi:hypothetical protein
MAQITYLGIGHRCHINIVLKLNGLRNCAYPFDSIFSRFEGIIDCIEFNFRNFFPKVMSYTNIYMGSKATMVDASGYRKIFKSKYFGFVHSNLLDPKVIETYNRRITRFNEYIRTTTDNVVFLRTILEDDEIDKHDDFVRVLYKVNPALKYKIIYIYDNINLPEFVKKKDDKVIVNSHLIVNNVMYKYIFNYLKNNNIFDIFDTLEPIIDPIYNSTNQNILNDGSLPYDPEN